MSERSGDGRRGGADERGRDGGFVSELERKRKLGRMG
jgi:hypothetical protein